MQKGAITHQENYRIEGTGKANCSFNLQFCVCYWCLHIK
jgi:hypothetical protein